MKKHYQKPQIKVKKIDGENILVSSDANKRLYDEVVRGSRNDSIGKHVWDDSAFDTPDSNDSFFWKSER